MTNAHDIAGNVLGVEFEALSSWQLAALALECIQEIGARAEDTNLDRWVREPCKNVRYGLAKIMEIFD